MRLEDIILNLDLREKPEHANPEIRALVSDSRDVEEGSLFVALPGLNYDGASFVNDAVRRGAVAVILQSEREIACGKIPLIRVSDARKALALAAANFYGHPTDDLENFAVTGTNGKTTTSFMIRDILRRAERCTGMIGTVCYEIGDKSVPARRTTPQADDIQRLASRMRKFGCDDLIMEVSSHALAQKRVYGVEYDVAVFTNLSQDHLNYHKDMGDYFAAKKILFDNLKHQRRLSVAVLNIDDPWGRKLLADGLDVETVTYGWSEDAMVRGRDLKITSQGCRFKVESPWGERRIRLGLPSRFNAQNALAALAACGARGIGLKTIESALHRLKVVPGRLEQVKSAHREPTVFVDYAHTADALANVLGALREVAKGRIITVFGCGGCRDTGKRVDMGRVVSENADYAFITTDNPRAENPGEIAAQIMDGFDDVEQYEVILDRKQAIGKALEMAGPKDIVLIAGKGHETCQQFADTVVPFDDRKVAAEFLNKTGFWGQK